MNRNMSDKEKVVALERILSRIVGLNISFRYRKGFCSKEITIIDPNADDLVRCYTANDYNELDFEAQLIKDESEENQFEYPQLGKGNAVFDKTSGEMIGVSKKFDAILTATITQYDDPYTEIETLKKELAEAKKPVEEPLPPTLESNE